MAAILKIQNGGYGGISAIINIAFQIPHVITFLEMYRFLIYHDSDRKKHSEPAVSTIYYINYVLLNN